MSPDSIPHISLGTAALIVFVVCAAFVMLRGMTRMIVGSVVLAFSAWIGFVVWQQAPSLSVEWFGKSVGIITNGLPLIALITSFLLARIVVKTIARPFGKSPQDAKKSSGTIIPLAFRLLFALIPTSIICLIGAILVHHTGSIAELSAYSEKSHGNQDTTSAKYSQKLKNSIEAALPASWIHFLDPLSDSARLNLAKIISSQSSSPLQPVIDARTGKPIPRAIIVDEPELQNLAREGKFGTLLRHPLLTKALAKPETQALLKDLKL